MSFTRGGGGTLARGARRRSGSAAHNGGEGAVPLFTRGEGSHTPANRAGGRINAALKMSAGGMT